MRRGDAAHCWSAASTGCGAGAPVVTKAWPIASRRRSGGTWSATPAKAPTQGDRRCAAWWLCRAPNVYPKGRWRAQNIAIAAPAGAVAGPIPPTVADWSAGGSSRPMPVARATPRFFQFGPTNVSIGGTSRVRAAGSSGTSAIAGVSGSVSRRAMRTSKSPGSGAPAPWPGAARRRATIDRAMSDSSATLTSVTPRSAVPKHRGAGCMSP